MHDLDRTTLETLDEGIYFGEEEDIFETGEIPFSEEEVVDLASQLLEVSSDQELDYFLGGLFKKAGKFMKSSTGRALGGMLKNLAKKALPIAGKAVGAYFGGPIGAQFGGKLAGMAGNYFGLEVEGLSPEDQNFEVAKQFVRLAGAAAQKAAASPAVASPVAASKTALADAARKFAPGLLGAAYPTASGGRSGRWMRRGSRIILYGV